MFKLFQTHTSLVFQRNLDSGTEKLNINIRTVTHTHYIYNNFKQKGEWR